MEDCEIGGVDNSGLLELDIGYREDMQINSCYEGGECRSVRLDDSRRFSLPMENDVGLEFCDHSDKVQGDCKSDGHKLNYSSSSCGSLSLSQTPCFQESSISYKNNSVDFQSGSDKFLLCDCIPVVNNDPLSSGCIPVVNDPSIFDDNVINAQSVTNSECDDYLEQVDQGKPLINSCAYDFVNNEKSTKAFSSPSKENQSKFFTKNDIVSKDLYKSENYVLDQVCKNTYKKVDVDCGYTYDLPDLKQRTIEKNNIIYDDIPSCLSGKCHGANLCNIF